MWSDLSSKEQKVVTRSASKSCAVVLKLSWSVAPKKFNWRILKISWHLRYAISRQSYLVKGSFHGPQRTAPYPQWGRGTLLRNHGHAFAELVKVPPIKHFNLIIAQNNGNLYQLHEKSCLGITIDEFFPQGIVLHILSTTGETSPGTVSKSMPRQLVTYHPQRKVIHLLLAMFSHISRILHHHWATSITRANQCTRNWQCDMPVAHFVLLVTHSW